MGRAVDDVRKREHRALAAAGHATLSGSKYLWLYAEENLPEQHRTRFAQLKALTLKTGRAWALKESLRELWKYTRVGWAERHWKRWYFWATHSRLTPVIETARTIQRHLPNVMTFFVHRITNAVTEGLNSKIQTIKKMAYGFRNPRTSRRPSTSTAAASTSTRLPTEKPDEPDFFRRLTRARTTRLGRSPGTLASGRSAAATQAKTYCS